MPVRLAKFHAAQDAQIRDPLPAALNGEKVPVGVECGRGHATCRVCQDRHRMIRWDRRKTRDTSGPYGVVEVFGEGDRRQPDLAGPLAGALHGSVLGVPGPLAVNVVVTWQDHRRSPVLRSTLSTLAQCARTSASPCFRYQRQMS